MKRITLKSVLATLAVMSLFIIYLLTCFPLINTTIFRWETSRVGSESEVQIQGNKSSSETANNIFTFDFGNPVTPEISDYILISITAKNTGPAKYPYGSIAVNLSEENIGPLIDADPSNAPDNVKDGEAGSIKDDKNLNENSAADNTTETNIVASPEIYKIQERTRIFVDSIKHTYYIPVGENKYWRNDWNLAGPTLKGQISSLEIEIPKIDGVDIQVNSLSLNRRPVFAADSHINYLLKSYFQLSYIDRYLTPAYVFLILFVVGFSLLCFLPKRIGRVNRVAAANDFKSGGYKSLDLKSINSSVCTANTNNINTDNSNSKSKISIGNTFKNNRSADSRSGFKTFAMLAPLFLLVIFSFYFISNYIFTVKGYWDSYKQYILSGWLDETYYGFSDYEKFVAWVGEKVPQGQNVIVLVKGEPIYIMAQMVYGLYPRDIKFVDISRMSAEEVSDKITNLDLTYEYIVVLSETDKVFLESLKVKLEYSYRETAGFIYKFILK